MSILFITMHPPYQKEIFVPQLGKKLNMTHSKMTWYKYVGVPIEVKIKKNISYCIYKVFDFSHGL